MTMTEDQNNTLSQGFGRVGRQISDPLLSICQRLSYLRTSVVAEAEREKAYLLDKNNLAYGIKPGVGTATINEMKTLFLDIPYSPDLFSYATAQARKAAQILKNSPAIQVMRKQWSQLDSEDRMGCLKDLSKIMVRVLNEGDLVCINDPDIAKAILPQGSAMQMHVNRQPGYDFLFTLICVDQQALDLEDFNAAAAFLWHEHQHIYMVHLREAFDYDEIPVDHPLYKDARKASMIARSRITGNIILSTDVYYTEPEEKLCYFTQDVFYAVFQYQRPVPTPSAPL